MTNFIREVTIRLEFLFSVFYCSTMDRRIFHIKNKVAQDLGRLWSVGNMADAVRMSVPHFQRLFKSHVGATPMVYLNDLRTERALAMLADPNCFLLIKEIGFQVGLVNNSHFTNGIKAKVGMTPSEFRTHHSDLTQSNSLHGNKQ